MKMILGGIERVVVGILCLAGFVVSACSPALADHTKPVPYGDVYRMDTGFAIALENLGEVYAVAAAPDGGYYAGGAFTTIGGQKHNQFAKFKADGTIDATFNAGVGFDGPVSAIAVQADGRIVVGGSFSQFDRVAVSCIARLNTDGSLDKTFDSGIGFNDTVKSVALHSDGRIVVGGLFTEFDGATCNSIAQLNADGSRDTEFSSGSGFDKQVNAVAVKPDGRIVVGGWFSKYNGVTQGNLACLNDNGTLDASFASELRGGVSALAIQPDGRIVAGGTFLGFYPDHVWTFARFNADGTLDTSFAPNYLGFMAVNSVALQPDGRILVGGRAIAKLILMTGTVVRFNPDGSIDQVFNTGMESDVQFDFPVNSVAAMPDGRVVVGGLFTWFGRNRAFGLVRLTSSGTADVPVAGACRQPGEAHIVPVADGKFIVGGDFAFVNDVERKNIARVNADGSMDLTFDPGFEFATPINFVRVQADEGIIVNGPISFNGSRLDPVRLYADGTVDLAFVPDYGLPELELLTVQSPVIQPDGRILVAGKQWTWELNLSVSGMVRLNTDGTLDPTFSSGSGFTDPSNATVESVALQADGRILVGGHFDRYNGTACGGIVRLNTDGTLDPTFNPGTGVGGTAAGNSPEVSGVAVQADGRILVSGLFEQFNGIACKGIVRLHANGSIDPTFHAGVDLHEFFTTLTLQDDGRILASDSAAGVVRLDANGHLDHRFVLRDLTRRGASEIAFTTDGRLLLSASGASRDGVSQVGVAVLKPEKLRGRQHHDPHRHDPPERPPQKGPSIKGSLF